ncbi:ribulose-phosphate 3-epimerase [Mycoplasma phocimorsus]|uniref:ribulose-phosphate 3-epimerase n=1 Tax=Mycoplasma phocimorsus TaxID=3045839 RepID=UPI0024C0031C|nr:ribulose-phosphate 3-epimerase [Mycoplasma phocimorsus]MDJ1649124.1 ribulose-phosphate 3-epimerase [Mycoplasma phocimorsus]
MRWKNISPSILDVKKENRLEFVTDLITNKGIKWIHYDVMDGIFVSNKAIELEEIINIYNNAPQHFSDVHLMISNPLDEFEKYKDYVSIVTLHFEAVSDIDLALFINRYHHDYKIGLAISPDTNVEDITPFLEFIDLVLVMSVYPGKGGQKFIVDSLDKIKKLKKLRSSNLKYSYLIQVDGGINEETSKLAWKAGADLIVAGSYIVKDPSQENINKLSFQNRYK